MIRPTGTPCRGELIRPYKIGAQRQPNKIMNTTSPYPSPRHAATPLNLPSIDLNG